MSTPKEGQRNKLLLLAAIALTSLLIIIHLIMTVTA